MKNLFLIFLCCLLFFSVAKAQIGFGPEIGISTCNMKMIAPSYFHMLSSGSIIGAKVGGIIDISLSNHLYFQSGLFFSIKGNTRSMVKNIPADTILENVDQTFEVHYLELPLNVLFKTGTQGMGRFFFGLGASIGIIVGGRNLLHDYGHIPNYIFDTSSNSKIVGGNDLGLLDVGLNIMAGYEFHSGAFFRAYYYYGFTDISTFGDESDKNRSWGITAGYFLGKARHKSLSDELIAP